VVVGINVLEEHNCLHLQDRRKPGWKSEMEETGKKIGVANQRQGKGQGSDWPLGTVGPHKGNYYKTEQGKSKKVPLYIQKE
jgi:hypothetical protein